MKKQGEAKLGLEGSEEGRWILIDYGDFVVHIFSPEFRAYYALEDIWGDAPQLDWQEPRRPSANPPLPTPGLPDIDSATTMNLLARLRELFGPALPEGADRAAFAAAVRPATDPKFGDYQANGCMMLAKALGAKPRDLAQEIARRVDLAPIAGPPEVAGPGFLNLRLNDDWVAQAACRTS